MPFGVQSGGAMAGGGGFTTLAGGCTLEAPPTALAWSARGSHLAVADVHGSPTRSTYASASD